MSPNEPTIGQGGEEREPAEIGRELEQIRRMGEERLEDLREMGGEIRRRVEDEVRNRPFVALGVAFGAGVVVSSLLASRFARLAILAAGGYAVREMFGDRLMEVLGPYEPDTSPPRRRKREQAEARGGGAR
jgi:hypothetical protein